jgi:hypothetical protein
LGVFDGVLRLAGILPIVRDTAGLRDASRGPDRRADSQGLCAVLVEVGAQQAAAFPEEVA